MNLKIIIIIHTVYSIIYFSTHTEALNYYSLQLIIIILLKILLQISSVGPFFSRLGLSDSKSEERARGRDTDSP